MNIMKKLKQKKQISDFEEKLNLQAQYNYLYRIPEGRLNGLQNIVKEMKSHEVFN
jgi:hypothetical protein